MDARLTTHGRAIDGMDVWNGLFVRRTHAAPPRKERHSASLAEHRRTPEDPTRESRLEQILDRATDVIGTREEAMRWLGTPVRALNYATPVSLLVDDAGADRVLAVLTNLEHGVL